MTSIKEKGTLLMCARVLSPFDRVRLYATLWTVAHQAPLSMGFSRQEHWCRLPCPPPGDLPDPGIKPLSPASPALQADSLPLNHQGSPWFPLIDSNVLMFQLPDLCCKNPYIAWPPPSLFRAVPQSDLRCCLLGLESWESLSNKA